MKNSNATDAMSRGLGSFYSRKHSLSKHIERRATKLRQTIRKLPRSYITAVFVLIPSVLYLLRALQYIVKPQLYAEDGAVWLADAYNKGVKSLFIPYNQFFHTFERIFALLVVHLPLAVAPFLFNISGFFIFVVLCYYLFSVRSSILTNNFQRLFLALDLGLIANFTQFYFNFSNSVFLLEIIGLLIYLAVPSRNKIVRIIEKISFVIICLTLPFVWLYLPVLLFDRLHFKRKNTFYLITALLTSGVQLCAYEFAASQRQTVPLSMLLSSKYVVIEVFNQIITPALFFSRVNYNLMAQANDFLPILITCLVILLFSLFVIVRHASLEFKYLATFLILYTLLALKGPIAGGNAVGVNILKTMAITPAGNRYFFFGILCLILIVVLTVSIYFKQRAPYLFLLLFMSSALYLSIATKSWVIHKNLFADYSKSYSKSASAFRKSRGTKTVIIPENPIGWSIVLNAKR
jgi:hypothetical protein